MPFNLLSQKLWEEELMEDIKLIEQVDNNSKLFIGAEEYIYLYDMNSGQKIYEKEIDDYYDDVVYNVFDGVFFTATDKYVLSAYDVLTGNKIWEREWDDLNQRNYTEYFVAGNTPIIRYNKLHLALDHKNGNIKWAQAIEYDESILQFQTWNRKELSASNLLFIINDDETMSFYSTINGSRMFQLNNMEYHKKLIQSNRDWFVVDSTNTYAFIAGDDFMIIYDLVYNKTVTRVKMDFDEDYEPFNFVDGGVIIMGEDAVGFFDFVSRRFTPLGLSASDFRTYDLMEYNGVKYFFGSFYNELHCYNLNTGQRMWAIGKGSEIFEGYIHKYLTIEDDIVYLAHCYGENPPNGGTWLHLLAVNLNDGSLEYKTDALFLTEYYIPSFTRFVAGISGDKLSQYKNIGFNYSVERINGDFLFISSSIVPMLHPESRDEGADGIVLIEKKSGKIKYRDFLELNDYTWNNKNYEVRKEYLIKDSDILLIGNISTALYDLKTMKRKWKSPEYDEVFVVDAIIKDEVVILKFGLIEYDVYLKPPGILDVWADASIKLNKKRNETPYGFIGLDLKNGNKLWSKEVDDDPGFLTPDFSLESNFKEKSKSLIFGDEENLYSLNLNGEYNWQIKFKNTKVGSIEIDEMYSIQEFLLARETSDYYAFGGRYKYIVKHTYDYTYDSEIEKFADAMQGADVFMTYKKFKKTWGSVAKKALGILSSDTRILAMGEKGVAFIDIESGKIIWEHTWNYDTDDVQYLPTIIGNSIISCIDEKFSKINMISGEKEWEYNLKDKTKYISSKDGKYIFTFRYNIVGSYKLM